MGLRTALLRPCLHTVGRLGEGVRLALDEGLTSGKTVDHVYRNEPAGRTPLGRWIDRRFLAHEGWEAVRQRRALLEGLLASAVEAQMGRRRRVHILDIASGPAAYIHAVLLRFPQGTVGAHCQDLEPRWVEEARQAATRAGLDNVTHAVGDAFDEAALRRLRPKPTIAVASGFYDWITDDDLVRRSMRILHAILPKGGHFVATNQVAHPDLESVTALFPDFRKQRLEMRMRDAGTLEAWLDETGFEVLETRGDAAGYYSVTLARRR